MKKLFILLLTLYVCTLSASASEPLPSEQYRDLAEHWAPTIYQDVNERFLVRADIPTRFDYDGDWRGDNNWENLENYPQIPSAYFSVRETLTHYFIEYDFYYPRDDGPISLEKHENDLEGCILVIRKDDTPFGQLQLMETQAHNHWYQYSNDTAHHVRLREHRRWYPVGRTQTGDLPFRKWYWNRRWTWCKSV